MKVDNHTGICGIFGYPISHSFSPAMHNAAFFALGLNYVYLPFEVSLSALPDAVAAIRAFNITGVNVTIPYKEKIINYLDELSQESKLIGAVNTIVNRNGRLIGYNTDGEGFLYSLKEALSEKEVSSPSKPLNLPSRWSEGKVVLLLGAGGAARAIAIQLALSGVASIIIANCILEGAQVLARFVQEKTGVLTKAILWPTDLLKKIDLTRGNLVSSNLLPSYSAVNDFSQVIREADLIVHCTPVGMFPKHNLYPLLPFECFHPGQVVYDLVYNPPWTCFLERIEKAGAKPIGGLGMLLHQGALAFKLWTGREAPLDIMREALEEEVDKQRGK